MVVETSSAPASSQLPLCVDLDGTLIATDMLVESVIGLVRQSPWALLALPWWLLSGKASIKRKAALRYTFDPATLPYHKNVVEFIRSEKGKGRRVLLVTASDQSIADRIAKYLGIFDEVVGSDGVQNLKGITKAKYLVERFGRQGFEYLGDSRADLPVWEVAAGGAVVTGSRALFGSAKRRRPTLINLPVAPVKLRTLVKAVRVHQWVKNVLIFVPAILAHKIFTLSTVLEVLIAFAAFSLCASVVYIINDLLDLDADRAHPSKSRRPFASGALPLLSALVLVPVGLLVAVSLAAQLPVEFCAILGIYFALTFGYSLFLKQVALVDIVLLAALYSIRLLAGGAATGVLVSRWLVAYAMFFFFSLACVKRYSELFGVRQANEEHVKGRGYRASDLEQIGIFGSSSAYLSILVLALYVNSNEVETLYREPWILWLLCPVVLYWISRVWLIAHRGEMHEDPIVFALTDKVSYLVGAIAGMIVYFAI